MSKPYTEDDLSHIFDTDLTWRRKELSDLKAAIKGADNYSRSGLLKAIIASGYAHWEGYVRICANKYFEHLALRKKPYTDFERQIYINSILVRLDALHHSRVSVADRCKLVGDILDGENARFSYINPTLIDTKSNLNTEVIREICQICSIDSSFFSDENTFIDVILLKRRNAIAHGQHEEIGLNEIDDFVAKVLSLMEQFRNLLENKVYTKSYAAA
jgi:hypothetical protein